MAKLTAGQIKGIAQDAGFTASEAVTMTAIALAESGGDPQSHNEVPPDDSYGLWQINMYKSLGPARLKQFGITSATQLFDPATNAVAARKIYSSSGFKAWSTYTSGAYLLYKGKAQSATASSQATQGAGDIAAGVAGGIISPLGTLLGADVGGAVSSAASTAINVGNDIAKVGSWISNPSNWLRILYVGGGAAALLFAMQALFKPVTDAAIKGAVKTASNVIPEAKAATKTANVVKAASASTPSPTTSPRPTPKPAPAKPESRSASSAADAKAIRRSGYSGSIRHDY